MDSTRTADADFSLVVDDPLYRAQQALGLIPRGGEFALARRIGVAIALTWLPLVAYAFWQQRLLPGGPASESLLEHFGTVPLIPVFATQIPLRSIAAKLLAPLVGI
jgi:hypothetical protein